MKRSSTKSVWLTIIFMLLTCSLSAQKVSLDIASKVAASWCKIHSQDDSFSFNPVMIDSATGDNEALIYHFRLTDGRFIWVSADYRHAPVLAYNLVSGSPADSLPHACRYFIDQYSGEISKTRHNNFKTGRRHPEWDNISKGIFKSNLSDEEVAPMVKSTWGQGAGYRDYTPSYTPTGCVAVAMLQIMRFWEYPEKGQGLCEWDHSYFGHFAVDFDTVDLKWDYMPLNEPNDRIARLMLYAGIALKMDWNSSGSGASSTHMVSSLKTNFLYNDHRIERKHSEDFNSISNWTKMLKAELLNERPLAYSGYNPDVSLNSGHSFILDGFTGDHFHVNWGWSGTYDGYYLLTSLTPGDYDYSAAQNCITGIFPGDTMMVDRPYKIRSLAGDSKIILAWEGIPHAGFVYHKIYRDQVEIGQTSRNIFIDEAVSPDQKYSYSVSAYYSIDNTGYESLRTHELISSYPIGIVLPYDEDFESGHPGWTISSTETGFNWGTAKELGLGEDEDSHFIGINSESAGEGKTVSDYLMSNQIDLSNSEYASLSFDYIFKQADSVDHLYLMYMVFEQNEWIIFHELEPTGSYSNWTNFKCYLPEWAMAPNAQIAFFYTDSGETGFGAGIDNIKIEEIYERGEPEFEVSANQMCMGQELVFTDLSQGTRNSYLWDFGSGADPRYAYTEGPHSVVYTTSGMKDVKLELNGLDRIEKQELIEIYPGPEASFSYTIDFKTVNFQNTTQEANSYLWSFGDGTESAEESPAHTYELSGYYPVRLIAMGSSCNDTTEIWINIIVAGKEDLESKPEISLYPNPGKGAVRISLQSMPAGLLKLRLYSITGEVVLDRDIHHYGQDAVIEEDFSNPAPGLYFLRISNGEINFSRKIFLK